MNGLENAFRKFNHGWENAFGILNHGWKMQLKN